MTKYYRISEAANLLGVSDSSLRKYTNEGKIEAVLTPGGQRVYTEQELNKFRGVSLEVAPQKVVGYVRSSSGQKASLLSQTQLIHTKYSDCMIVKDKSSGLNEKRTGLQKILRLFKDGEVNVLVVCHKDRLARFGVSYIEQLVEAYGGRVEYLVDDSQKSLQEELMSDFMMLIASFSGKFYRLRGYEQQHRLLDAAKNKLK